MISSHSPRAHAAYLDLLRLLQDDQVVGIIGSAQRLIRNGRGYWYDLYRIGTSVKNRYLGEDSPEMQARAAERARLVRTLRAEGVPSTDRATGALLAGMERAGVLRLGGTIVGTHAFRLYEAELGVRLGETDLTQTGDLDIAQFEKAAPCA